MSSTNRNAKSMDTHYAARTTVFFASHACSELGAHCCNETLEIVAILASIIGDGDDMVGEALDRLFRNRIVQELIRRSR